MMLAMPLVAHLLMSILMLSIPNLTRKEILFGVVLPGDFRSRPESRRAIRDFRATVAIFAIAGAIAIAVFASQSEAVFLLAPSAMLLAGFASFISQNRKLKAFAVEPQPIRAIELTTESERLPWFTWLGLLPLLAFAGVALYLNVHWDSIPSRYPIHFDINGSPNRWVDKSLRRVYSPLIFGSELAIWLFGFAIAIWYGSRRSEPLRRPVVGFMVFAEWSAALTMTAVALNPVVHLPPMVPLAGMPLILVGVIYLIKKSNDPRAPVDPTPNECWKGGMIYYNPNDAALFVARRDGVGFTSNMGNPWSWVMLGSLPVMFGIGALLLR